LRVGGGGGGRCSLCEGGGGSAADSKIRIWVFEDGGGRGGGGGTCAIGWVQDKLLNVVCVGVTQVTKVVVSKCLGVMTWVGNREGVVGCGCTAKIYQLVRWWVGNGRE
jgi:hypothetical protein